MQYPYQHNNGHFNLPVLLDVNEKCGNNRHLIHEKLSIGTVKVGCFGSYMFVLTQELYKYTCHKKRIDHIKWIVIVLFKTLQSELPFQKRVLKDFFVLVTTKKIRPDEDLIEVTVIENTALAQKTKKCTTQTFALPWLFSCLIYKIGYLICVYL